MIYFRHSYEETAHEETLPLLSSYAFVEFKNEEDAEYGIKIMNMVKLFNKPIRCTKATQDKKTADVGANLFIGNLDPMCDDKLLWDTFASFGQLLFAKVMCDPDTGSSREFGFVSYDAFEASDAALAAMNGQWLCNSPITVSYAYKKDTVGERHGTPAERLIADHKPAQIADHHLPPPDMLGRLAVLVWASGIIVKHVVQKLLCEEWRYYARKQGRCCISPEWRYKCNLSY